MGDITHIKVFSIEGGRPNPVGLYRKLTRSFIDAIKADNAKWYYFNVTDQKRADLYERAGKTVKGYNIQRAEKCFYLHRQ